MRLDLGRTAGFDALVFGAWRMAAWRMAIVPVLFYLASFVILTWPLIVHFSTHFYADEGDGLQNVWNLWWVAHAVRARQSPWFTDRLYHPDGVTLLAHTLNPFNGFVVSPLLGHLTLVQAHNAVVLLGFVGAGWTAFLLAYHLTGSWVGSLLAGYLFTFSSFHIAHATGHLQLVSLEWLPLFLLLWHRFLDVPRIRTGIGAAVVLFFVLLCDYYYFGYSIGAAAILVIWHAIARRDFIALVAPGARLATAAFISSCLLTSGPLVLSLMRVALTDPLLGSHPTEVFSTDLWAAFVPGGHWRLSWLTEPIWTAWKAHKHESSVSLGVVALLLTSLAWTQRARFPNPSLRAWLWIGAVFWLLSLGPALHVGGRRLFGGLPYGWLESLIPPLRLSGVPVRMMIMVQLAVALFAAFGWSVLARGSALSRAGAAVAVVGMVFELLPAPLPTTPPAVPRYVEVVRDYPKDAALLDLVNTATYQLLHQTVHGKPLPAGYIARVPASVERKRGELVASLLQWDRPALCNRHRLGFVLLDHRTVSPARLRGVRPLYQEDSITLLALICP